MNLETEASALRVTLRMIAELHSPTPDDGRLCAAGCWGSWPCSTRDIADSWGSGDDRDAPSALSFRPQAAEQAEVIPEVGSGNSEGSEVECIGCPGAIRRHP